MSKQAGKKASWQPSKKARQVSWQPSKKARQVSMQAKQASIQAIEHSSKQAFRRHSVGAMPYRGLFFKSDPKIHFLES